MADNVIELKSVGDLLGKKFFIPSYQRGYRWSEQQVKDLLNDINEFTPKPVIGTGGETWYCLQPIVVRIMPEDDPRLNEEFDKTNWYEVIDGQQRLTTVYLIVHYFNEMWNSKKNGIKLPQIKYETRTDSYRFINSLEIDDHGNVLHITGVSDCIDFHYMKEAYGVIHQWSSKKESEGFNCNDFQSKFIHKTRFIWYESVEENPIKVFTRLNIGKISLTNAELIRALFLNKSNFESANEHHLRLRQMEIASEWDSIEFTLQNEEFWLFLKETGYERPTRIDFIFDIICKKNRLRLTNEQLQSIGTDEYRTFRYFYEYFKSKDVKIEQCWKIVKDYYHTFLEWYNDLELYHYVGYLIEHKCPLLTLLDEWSPLHKDNNLQSVETKEVPKDKAGFVTKLKERIKDVILNKYKREATLMDALEYQYKDDGSDKGKCKPILLFHNIQTIINQNQQNIENEKYKIGVFHKFPFHIYKQENWDVEHINSNTTNQEETEDTQKEWLLNIYLGAVPALQGKIEEYLTESNEDNKQKLFIEIQKEFPPHTSWSAEEKNRIWNYALLDSSTNRSYGNAIFSGKRRVIIGKDKGMLIAIPQLSKNGNQLIPGDDKEAPSSFVPLCTKYVFMKFYSPVMNDPNYWTEVDAKGYLEDIKACIKQLEE